MFALVLRINYHQKEVLSQHISKLSSFPASTLVDPVQAFTTFATGKTDLDSKQIAFSLDNIQNLSQFSLIKLISMSEVKSAVNSIGEV